MSSWIPEASLPQHNGNGFAHIADPSAVAGVMMDPSFMGNPAAQFNPQFATPPMPMQNGPIRNASPSAFQNAMYPTNSVIPAKRRAREDSIGQSPRPAPGMIPTSRAETPQQSFPGFQQPGMPQQSQSSGQPSPYPHLQPNGSANASPSPIMANQMRPGSVPQRVSTASPHPFSPASQQFPQTSPVPSEHGGNPQAFIQPNAFPQGFNPQFQPGQSPAPRPPSAMGNPLMAQQMAMGMPGQIPQQMPPQMTGQMPNQMPTQMPSQMAGMMMQQPMGQPRNPMDPKQQQLLYQMQMQNQARQMGAQPMMSMQPNQMHPQAAQARMMAGRQNVPNGQMPPGAMRPQQGAPPQQPMGRPPLPPPDQWMKNLHAFMQSKGKPLDMNPTVENRPVLLYNLFQLVAYRYGGYRHVTQSQGWPQISHQLGFPPQQMPAAPPQIKAIYERYLFNFEEMWMQKMRMQQHGGMPNPQQMQQQGTPTKGMPPGQIMQPGQQPPHLQQGQMPSPVKPPGPPGANGFPAPHPAHGQQRHSISRSVHATPTGEEFPLQSPARSKAGSISVLPENQGMTGGMTNTIKFPAPFGANPDEYMPSSREHTTFGGVDFSMMKVGEDLQRAKIDVPSAVDLGNVDLHTITKSIQSGIHGEVRLALDVLAILTSSDHHFFTPVNYVPIPQIDLRHCGELVEALLECAEEQVDTLVENTEEASNDVLISPYEDVVRACRIERLAVRSIPAPGSLPYDLDRSVDRLVCITTILRNLSWREENHKALADQDVIRFLCVVIRYMGTREMLLRSHANTLDLMKDLVTLLSNIAGSIELPDREQAFCLLQFLLAFAPTPAPAFSNDRLFFTPYEPRSHPYLPHAVDSLAKLLARDRPNRTHYTAIFASESVVNSSPPCELLTKAFALAISPIPDVLSEPRNPRLPPLVEARKPFLMQGLLAADIIAGIAPGHETGVTRSWLSSGNGFSQNLFALLRHLSAMYEGPVPRGQSRGQPKRDPELVYIVTTGINMLRRLADKARDPNAADKDGGLPPDVLPNKESVLRALQLQSQDWSTKGMLADLRAFAGLTD
ncbi:hypothetical protein QBC35DRAFT_229301 [Podospora australis]|uniref:ARID domain-containing protein n=1 Tax=Podospora australis TaxID=1536484 RepID=A0AAN7AIA6_9PEZI|nr:hypothetical protein QBC35DRAFT_229301 [Podospora australis]